jgi:large subunit ribosomal protein L25
LEQVITAEIRQKAGKGENRRLRKEGKIPAVLYGKDTESMKLTLSARELQRLADAESTKLMKLKIQGNGERAVLLKDVQYDHLYKDVQHVDLHEVSLTEKLTVTVPLILTGEENRVKDEGIVQQLLREVDVECLPTLIPDQIVAEISSLTIGQSLSVGELVADEGIEIITPAEETVVTIVLPSKEEEPEEEDVDETEETGEEASEEEEA